MALKLAVIGVGRWGINHVRVLTQLRDSGEGVEEVIVVDRDRGRARYVAERFRADSFLDDLSQLLSRQVDAAVVSVPTIYHYDVSRRLIPYMDLLIEKPLASKLEEGLEIVRLAEKYDRVVSVGHIERYNPVVMAVKDKLAELNERVIQVVGQRIGPGPVGKKTGNLGVAHDLLVHDVDIVNLLLNELPTKVFAITHKEPSFPYEVDIQTIYGYPSGAQAYLRASWRAGPTLKKRAMVLQTRTTVLTFDYISQEIAIERGLSEHRSSGEYMDIVSSYKARRCERISLVARREHEPLLLELKDFVKSVERRKRPLVDVKDGYVALKCVLHALKSAELNRPVEITWDDLS